jgi:hypothetical protein
MTTYYVSSIVGSDKNAGTSGSAPLASLQAAEALTKPGDTVEVMNGTYTGPGGGNVLTISTSGTASAPITFEAAPGATPVIDSSGTWQGIEIDASYITINGLTIVGDAANYNLSSATAGYSTGNPDLDGNGIAATSGTLVHNLIIENNTVYNEPGGGIIINSGDYLQILNNNVHDNAHWSAYGTSGISIGASENFDNGAGPHIIISDNTSVNNANLVPEYRAGAITDGEGIILDSNSGYTGGFLIQNNTTHGSSGPGIESFESDNAVITGNTATGDLTNAGLVSEGEIFINQSSGNTVTGNITAAAPPPPPAGQLIVNGSFETHDFGGWTVGGNSGASTFGPQMFIDTTPENGTYAVALGSMGSDGTLSQTIATTAGSTYTLSFWLKNEESDTNDFKATWNGQTLLALTNAAQSGYTQYTYTVTATGAASTLQFSARNDQSQWDLDNISLTASGTSSAPPPAATPTITGTSDSPATGALSVGKTVTLTLGFSSAVTVVGKPTLTLNDGGTATYASGSGTNALTFNYTVATGQNTASLAATAVNLASGVTIKTSAGAAANLSLTGLTQSGPQIDTAAPAAPGISSDTVSGNIATLKGTAAANSTITVFDNSTKLGAATANSSGAWTFATGALASGSQSFTATATDAAGNVSPLSSALVGTLAATGGGASSGSASGGNLVTNGSFETDSFSGWTVGGNSAVSTYGPQLFIDTTPENGTYAAALGSMGSDGTLSQTIATTAGKTYTLSFWLKNEGSDPNDFKATWNGQTLLSLANATPFGYTQYTYSVTATGAASTLQFSARNDPSQWDLDNISLTANGSVSAQVDTVAPTVMSLVASPATANLNAGKAVALTLAFSENVTVAGGRPTLKLNDGGTATYVSGSGTKALTFSYTVAAGQGTASLAATAISLASGVTIKDSAGNAANLSLAGRTQSGPQIDTTTPTITGINESPATGDLGWNEPVAFTLTFSEPMTVAGRPTLTLNDGGTAFYQKGSSTNTWTFYYHVAAGQNIASLAATAVNLPNGATIKDSAGNAAKLSLTSQHGPQIDTAAPTVTSVTASPGTGTQFPGDPITITVKMNEAVKVTGGAPVLLLNDGGTATYVSGSGTNTLTFKYTVEASDKDVSTLGILAAKLPAGVTIKDGAGNTANMAGAVHSFAGLAVDPPIVSTKPDGSYDVAYSDVTGLSYSSYEDIFNSAGVQAAEARDMIGGAGTLILNADHLTVSSSSGSLGVTTGPDSFEVNSQTSESIVASGRTAETFEYGSGFGHESIAGLLASGPSNDVIEFHVAMFQGLSSRNTATQNWDALVSSGGAVQSGANVVITDAAHDVLTLNNVTTSMLSHYAGSVFKFV